MVEGEAGDDPDARGAVGVGATGPVELAIHRQEGALASDALDGGIAAQGEEGRVAEGAGVGVGGEEGIVEVADACVGRLRQGGLGRDLAVVAQLGEGQAAAVRVAHHGAAAFGRHLERRGTMRAYSVGRCSILCVEWNSHRRPDLERVDHVGIAPHDGCQLPDVRRGCVRWSGLCRGCRRTQAKRSGLHAIRGRRRNRPRGRRSSPAGFRFGKLQQVAVGLRHGDTVVGVAREATGRAGGAGHDIGGIARRGFQAEAPLGLRSPRRPSGSLGRMPWKMADFMSWLMVCLAIMIRPGREMSIGIQWLVVCG